MHPDAIHIHEYHQFSHRIERTRFRRLQSFVAHNIRFEQHVHMVVGTTELHVRRRALRIFLRQHLLLLLRVLFYRCSLLVFLLALLLATVFGTTYAKLTRPICQRLCCSSRVALASNRQTRSDQGLSVPAQYAMLVANKCFITSVHAR